MFRRMARCWIPLCLAASPSPVPLLGDRARLDAVEDISASTANRRRHPDSTDENSIEMQNALGAQRLERPLATFLRCTV